MDTTYEDQGPSPFFRIEVSDELAERTQTAFYKHSLLLLLQAQRRYANQIETRAKMAIFRFQNFN